MLETLRMRKLKMQQLDKDYQCMKSQGKEIGKLDANNCIEYFLSKLPFAPKTSFFSFGCEYNMKSPLITPLTQT